MSDVPVQSTPADPDPGAAPDPAPVADPASPPPEGVVDPGADPATPAAEPTEPKVFDEKYVGELRDEAANWRTKLRETEESYTPFKEVFDGVDPDARDAVLEMAKTLIADPENAGPAELIRVAKLLTGDRFDEVAASLEKPKYLTAEEAAEVARKEREAAEEARAQKEAIEQVHTRAKELGYKEDTPEIAMLYWFASRETNADLDEAHAKVQAFRQQAVDETVQQIRETNEGYPPATGAVGEPSAQPAEGPKSFEEARNRLTSRLNKALSGTPG